MVLLLAANAWATTVTVCNAACDYPNLDSAVVAMVAEPPGAHTIQVSFFPTTLSSQVSVPSTHTITIEGGGRSVAIDGGGLRADGGTIIVNNLALGATSAQTVPMLEAVNGGTINYTGASILQPQGTIQGTMGRVVGAASTLSIQDTALNGNVVVVAESSHGSLLQADQGLLQLGSVSINAPVMTDQPVIHGQNAPTITWDGGSLTGLTSEADGAVLNTSSGSVTIDNVSFGDGLVALDVEAASNPSLFAGNNGVSFDLTNVGFDLVTGTVFDADNAAITLTNVDLISVTSSTGAALFDLTGPSTLQWTGGRGSELVSDDYGAIHMTSGTATLTSVLMSGLTGNTGASLGTFTSADLTLDDVTASAASQATAMIDSQGELTVLNSSLVGADDGDVGVIHHTGGTAYIATSTFSGGDCVGNTTDDASSIVFTNTTVDLIDSDVVNAGTPGTNCEHVVRLENAAATLDGMVFSGNEGTEAVVFADTNSSIAQGAFGNGFDTNTIGLGAVTLAGDATLGTSPAPFTADFIDNIGRAIRVADGPVHITSSGFVNNQAADGGAIYVASSGNSDLVVTGSRFQDNQATNGGGGAVAMASTGLDSFVSIGNTYDGNQASADGGAVACRSSCSFDGDAFTNNSTPGDGGGVFGVDAAVVVVNDTLFALNSGDRGAAVFLPNDGQLDITRSHIRQNTAVRQGTVHNRHDSSTTIAETVFCGNTTADTTGAAVYTDQATTVDVTYSAFLAHTKTPVWMKDANHGLFEHTTFINDGTPSAIKGIDGAAVDILVRFSLFGDVQPTEQPIDIILGGGETARWASSFVDSTVYVAPSDADVVIDNVLSATPAELELPALADIDCNTVTMFDVIPGPTSDAWTRPAGPDTHWGAYYPEWGVNTDQDESPWIWDCVDGDADDQPAADRETAEVCDDQIDNDCDGLVDEGCLFYPDGDGDGFGDPTAVGGNFQTGWVDNNADCDDTNDLVYPNAPEVCDGVDNDCDTQTDEGLLVQGLLDADNDGYGVDALICPGTGATNPEIDCNDADPAINPGATEVCANTVDDDCDPATQDANQTWYVDVDGDGHAGSTTRVTCTTSPDQYATSTDCDDADPTVNPSAPELCNGNDDDCDGSNDEGLAQIDQYPDNDGDGYGLDALVRNCANLPNHVANPDDCDDTAPAINPAAIEICNDIDDNCDGQVDENLPLITQYADTDNDQFGAGTAIEYCALQPGNVLVDGDCAPNDPSTYPTAPEQCDDVDHNCNGPVDDGVTAVDWFPDTDGDGFGAGTPQQDCAQPPGTVASGTDCDDGDPNINPVAIEICDGIDQDCDNVIDDGLPTFPLYEDLDNDDYGTTPAGQTCRATAPGGTAFVDGDCDDTDRGINPSANEICDGIDNDCDTLIDDNDGDAVNVPTWYFDNDGDAYGAIDSGVITCNRPAGSISAGGDCDDANILVFPGAPENCRDTLDNDCDGLIDDADPDFVDVEQDYWLDADGDGFGDPSDAQTGCGAPPPGYVLATEADCLDTNDSVNPAADEVCDTFDNDCNGLTDELDPGLTDGRLIYEDYDTDGYGDPQGTLDRTCDSVAPVGTSFNADDCDDLNSTIYPGAVEDCSDEDRDCSGDPYDAADVYYRDADLDGYGDPDNTFIGCPSGSGWITVDGDCDDTAISINPDAIELCDDIDQDCDGDPWEGDPIVYLIDEDCDEVPGSTLAACDPAELDAECAEVLEGPSPDLFDCDDLDPDVGIECPEPEVLDPIADTGCTCSSGGAGGSWLGLVVLLSLARRGAGRDDRQPGRASRR